MQRPGACSSVAFSGALSPCGTVSMVPRLKVYVVAPRLGSSWLRAIFSRLLMTSTSGSVIEVPTLVATPFPRLTRGAPVVGAASCGVAAVGGSAANTEVIDAAPKAVVNSRALRILMNASSANTGSQGRDDTQYQHECNLVSQCSSRKLIHCCSFA